MRNDYEMRNDKWEMRNGKDFKMRNDKWEMRNGKDYLKWEMTNEKLEMGKTI